MKRTPHQVKNLSAVAISVAMLVSCNQSTSSNQNQLVECYGVAKAGADVPLLMTKDMCDKLPATKQSVVTNSDYVQCYGVAAAGKNGCATKTNSCGGFIKTARAKDAWVSLPVGVCKNLEGAILKNAKEE